MSATSKRTDGPRSVAFARAFSIMASARSMPTTAAPGYREDRKNAPVPVPVPMSSTRAGSPWTCSSAAVSGASRSSESARVRSSQPPASDSNTRRTGPLISRHVHGACAAALVVTRPKVFSSGPGGFRPAGCVMSARPLEVRGRSLGRPPSALRPRKSAGVERHEVDVVGARPEQPLDDGMRGIGRVAHEQLVLAELVPGRAVVERLAGDKHDSPRFRSLEVDVVIRLRVRIELRVLHEPEEAVHPEPVAVHSPAVAEQEVQRREAALVAHALD